MPRGSGRRVIGQAVDGRGNVAARSAGSRWSVRRRHAIYRTTLTIICLVVGVSDGDHYPSSASSEDTAETTRRPTMSRVVDAVDGPSVEFHTGEDHVTPNHVKIQDSFKGDFSSDVKQSNWLSACLRRILFASREFGQLEYVEASSLSTYHDVFKAVVAAHGGEPPDDVIDAVLDCARRRSTPSPRRRRRRSRRSARGCRCRREAAVRRWNLPRTSPGDGATPHLEGVHRKHAHLRQRRSVANDDDEDDSCAYEEHLEQVRISTLELEQSCATPQPVFVRIPEWKANWSPRPEKTTVNRCRCDDVCKNASHRCVAVSSRNVTRCFRFVRFFAGGETEEQFRSYPFVEDVRCECSKPATTSTRTIPTTTISVSSSSTLRTTSPADLTTSKRCPAPFEDQPVCVCRKKDSNCRNIVRGKKPLNNSSLTCIQQGDCYDAICTHRRTSSLNETSGYCQAKERRRRHRHGNRKRRRD